MGQVLDRFQGKEWKKKQVKLITDRVYDRICVQSGRSYLTFDDLYIAVLLVFNDINKRLPGPHFDPPSKDRVRDIIKVLLLASFDNQLITFHLYDICFESAVSNWLTEVEGSDSYSVSKCLCHNECDINLDGGLDREEFAKFMQQLTAETIVVVSQGLLVTLVVAPTVAMATKRATEGVPGVGKVVQKVPNSVFASLVTLAVVWFQHSDHEAV
ncbi:hypothetical protein LINGRAHAP2_LOCUS27926 [Linum grandiflorum]